MRDLIVPLCLFVGPSLFGLTAPILGARITAGSPAPGSGGLPSGCTDNTIARADGTAGATQCSTVTVADTTGAMVIPASGTITFTSASAELVATDGILGVTGSAVISATAVADTFQVSGSSDALKMDSSGVLNIADSGNNNIAGFRDDGTSALFFLTPEAFTIADSGGGGAATSTDLPNSSLILATCSDADGCDWTPTETSAINGATVRIVNVGANTLTIVHAAGAVLLNGGTSEALGQYDSLMLVYSTTASAWIQMGATGNN